MRTQFIATLTFFATLIANLAHAGPAVCKVYSIDEGFKELPANQSAMGLSLKDYNFHFVSSSPLEMFIYYGSVRESPSDMANCEERNKPRRAFAALPNGIIAQSWLSLSKFTGSHCVQFAQILVECKTAPELKNELPNIGAVTGLFITETGRQKMAELQVSLSEDYSHIRFSADQRPSFDEVLVNALPINKNDAFTYISITDRGALYIHVQTPGGAIAGYVVSKDADGKLTMDLGETGVN